MVCGLIHSPELIRISALEWHGAVNPHLNLPHRQSLVARDLTIVMQIVVLADALEQIVTYLGDCKGVAHSSRLLPVFIAILKRGPSTTTELRGSERRLAA
jgi:hypothetical protein